MQCVLLNAFLLEHCNFLLKKDLQENINTIYQCLPYYFLTFNCILKYKIKIIFNTHNSAVRLNASFKVY